MTIIYEHDLPAKEVIRVIQTGETEKLKLLVSENPDLIKSRIVARDHDQNQQSLSRTLLHIITDWPGHFPNGAETVKVLADAGADVNARCTGPHTETPLHWAASSDDVEVLNALLNAGADIDADGAVIGGGTPLDDAVAFAQWKAARRLVEHGAKTKLWNEAALGMIDQVKKRFEKGKPPTPDQITEAFWLACHGSQQMTAAYLLDQGADLNWIGYDDMTPLDVARRNQDEALVQWLVRRGARGK
ncbi:ankyrin repeat domain-containing protein [Jeotgalibacillus haloalkalitolerans]|uniref:Ankyrin repeat domain-containing protein n=1 Tax=Jeotgalibacillus haloalkalitolerans TaxID=3104292 RepID=A0ABU5KNZ2_9BACL|nr:ankyrin repeat domain-containing protein [Jeotgalibacillus sp. HH7-29]MDZ5712676.1 ankyrin repeat domain-containing protein [Jeotgalibacillus sp. HH7-29]